ncbi:BRCA1-associated RING domain protein 1 isoform X2 [Alligator sinensis]|uniref:BRCA1-associated RING domain protein 1 isoform X2 n=1 Tax=Alligator sinensis TaxID=38654 RepID=A0A3Q0GAI1_ALLSI|nr:BRCA1-associated RING domain protein 1 isoform X2 [Alligator sinensis]
MQAALRARSGNRPLSPVMERPSRAWHHTRAALEQLEAALRCSRCDHVLREPVCLDQCEHVFCLDCVGDCVGTECPVCHMPAWVQDVQINRQLNNMIQLCSKLRQLLGTDPALPPDSAEDLSTSIRYNQDMGNKKQIKMWFSPRSRKIRCILNKNQEVTNADKISQDAPSVYDFSPSPSHEKTSKQSKKPARGLTKKLKKKRLADFNKVWGIEKEKQKDGSRPEEKEASDEFSGKKVSFCSQPLVASTPEPKSTEKTLGQESVKETNLNKNGSKSYLEMSTQVKPVEDNDRNKVACPAEDIIESGVTTGKPLPGRNKETLLKCGRQQSRSPALSHSKRPRTSEKSTSRQSVTQQSPQNCCTNMSLAAEDDSLVDISSVYKHTGGTVSKPKNSSAFKEINSPLVSKAQTTPSTPNNWNQMAVTQSPSLSKKYPDQSTTTKRNHKGETLLHIASIKGDLTAVELLLKNGADPNVKDHAGWTPLHEACNHGHKEVVELLLQHGALVNTTGYHNDSPLHDAAKNGHVSIVELLLLHGASHNALNIFGLRPVDYAETEKMKSVLMLPGKNESSSFSQSVEQASPNHPKDGPVILLGSSLSSDKQKLLSKLSAVLKARRCMEFNSTVTHVIVPDDSIRSTFKYMMAVLSGCWVLKFEWVKACLQSRVREEEEKYEISGGPQKGRLNRIKLLPKLFDGCYFYFLGTFTCHQKNDLTELVKAGGGQILIRQPKPDSDVTQSINTVAYHAEPSSDQSFCTQYIIYDVSSKYKPDKIRQGKVWMAPSSWMIDCVMSFQLLPVTM